jgi:hypothetical protein
MSEDNGTTTYVVQKHYEDEGVWKDIATVRAPARTKRRTVVERAHADHPLSEGDYVRVLDAESARTIPIALEEQPPRLKIG